jgi:endonuclease-3
VTENFSENAINIENILNELAKAYPEAKCGLNYRNPFELLVATILSAQTTDERVNKVTERLFYLYPSPKEIALAPLSALENEVRELGLFRNKAKHLKEMAQQLLQRFNGEVPSNLVDLTSLPGVGRKTANVVLSNAFNVPAIAVDTHVFRVSGRLGLSFGNTPWQVEQDLMAIIPKDKWSQAHHWLIHHGRKQCLARRPLCESCSLNPYCPKNRL